MKSQILETSNYDLFEMHNMNRDVKVEARYFAALVESMKNHGFISAYPLHCTKTDGGKIAIKGGHHRFAAAIEAGIPVKYVLCEDKCSIQELEKAGPGKWKPADYLVSYCRQGVEAYQILSDYMCRTGIGLNSAASMLFGQTAGSQNFRARDRFQDGRYEVRDTRHANDVADVVLALRSCGIQWFANNILVIAFSYVLKAPDVSKERLISKTKTHYRLYERPQNLDSALLNIESVYNYKARSDCKKNIAFMARTSAHARNVVKHKK